MDTGLSGGRRPRAGAPVENGRKRNPAGRRKISGMRAGSGASPLISAETTVSVGCRDTAAGFFIWMVFEAEDVFQQRHVRHTAAPKTRL